MLAAEKELTDAQTSGDRRKWTKAKKKGNFKTNRKMFEKEQESLRKKFNNLKCGLSCDVSSSDKSDVSEDGFITTTI